MGAPGCFYNICCHEELINNGSMPENSIWHHLKLCMHDAGVTELKIQDNWDIIDPSASSAMDVDDCDPRVQSVRELTNDRVRNFNIRGAASTQVIQGPVPAVITPQSYQIILLNALSFCSTLLFK